MIQNYFESRYKELQEQEITRINYYKYNSTKKPCANRVLINSKTQRYGNEQ